MVARTKALSILLLLIGETATMSLWFVSAAILPEITAEAGLHPTWQAALSSGVQAGFVIGALTLAILGVADRYDPRRVIAVSALIGAASNLALLVVPLDGVVAVGLRVLTGASLAGVYPVGMKIAVGWGSRDRGFLVGMLIGALTVGTAAPHLISYLGDGDWRMTVMVASALAAAGGLSVLAAGLGPLHAPAPTFDPKSIRLAWTNREIRLAYAGYFGHMWELYAFWAWVGAAAAASYGATMGAEEAGRLAKLTAFLAIGLGGFACVPAGMLADRIGKARVAQWAMILSGGAALATALSFGEAAWATFALMLFWGMAVVPDSAQFSALVADAAPDERAGSLMTFQTALGFTLTAFTVQVVPTVVELAGWPATLALMALGPAFGVEAMRRLINHKSAIEPAPSAQ
ncbi:MAG: MFS transporter [Rhodospirillales bacterium]|jgi:MFS family permease|nr:MFS transporter [Rhodospirillales bacterium]MDP6774542.1 MFS transporter [Rhodospirillales bacterium]